MRLHFRSDYATLRHIDEIGPQTDREQSCLNEIGGSLVEGRLNNILGAGLLHRHFEVDDLEVMLEVPEDNSDVVWTSPVTKASRTVSDMPTLVAFGGDQELVGMEYVPHEYGAGRDVAAFATRQLLTDIHEILRRHDCEKTFGLISIRDERDLNGDEIFLETCDPEQRSLRSERISLNHPDVPKSIQTRWFWKLVEVPTAYCKGACEQKYVGVCVGACQAGPDQHRSYHDVRQQSRHIKTGHVRT